VKSKGSISKLGKKNPAFKHGLCRKAIKYRCPICRQIKMKIGYCKSCRDCYHKSLKGKGNPMYGKFSAKKYYCIDCRTEINHGYKRCHTCAGKHIWITSKKLKNRDYFGKNNPNYKGGLSNKPYSLEFNDTLKYQIRTRDNFECQNCGMTEEEHLSVLGTVLIVHHIDYDKQHNKENNLLTLCNQCNGRANYNRKYWNKFYQEKIYGLQNKS
jgi:5-methylcytosine-specific restriction endonuclease McrA